MRRKRVFKRDREFHSNPRIDPSLKKIFNKIGVPEKREIIPDPFQLEAISKIKGSDLLVSAPTGAGKTWIAIQVIQDFLFRGMRVWYASPLKALSNSIYSEFCHLFGQRYCGIITGDRKENPDAPIIVGTTEILRNQLYDAMHHGVDTSTDLVILDEAHYMNDPERGVVWEEVLIYLPQRVKILMLSATISNPEEIASWLQEIRGKNVEIVSSFKRPVPLEMLFLFPDGLVVPLSKNGRRLNPDIERFLKRRPKGRREIDFARIIGCLRELNLLPAIFFLKSRLDCNSALWKCQPHIYDRRDETMFREELSRLIDRYPYLKDHPQMRHLVECRVAAHHAGQLPQWKMVIETLMNRGYLDAIFSTSTVAAGVNFPARSVILVQSDRYDGKEFKDLTATELHQMIGRAGRRGKDKIGFAIIVPGIYQDPELILELKNSPPEPIESQIHINFSMTLNLLLSHRPSEIKELLNKSFAAFKGKKRGREYQMRWEGLIEELKSMIPDARCDTDDPQEMLENIRIRAELKEEIRMLKKEIRRKIRAQALREYLKPGRLFLAGSSIYLLFFTKEHNERFECLSHNINKPLRMRKGRLRLKKIKAERIKKIFDLRLDLGQDLSIERIQRIIRAIRVEDLRPIKIGSDNSSFKLEEIDRLKRFQHELPCTNCPHKSDCHGKRNRQLKAILNEFESLYILMERMAGGLWLSFKRHLRFLKETGFVDEDYRLTPDGIWASKLRLDHPLLVSEAIRKGAFDDLSPESMAGCMATFVWDKTQDFSLSLENREEILEINNAFKLMESTISEFRDLQLKKGFEAPQLLFWPSAILYLWAKGKTWEELRLISGMDEGDMVSLILRTADHLRQVVNLKDTHPSLSFKAERAIKLILREPAYIV